MAETNIYNYSIAGKVRECEAALRRPPLVLPPFPDLPINASTANNVPAYATTNEYYMRNFGMTLQELTAQAAGYAPKVSSYDEQPSQGNTGSMVVPWEAGIPTGQSNIQFATTGKTPYSNFSNRLHSAEAKRYWERLGVDWERGGAYYEFQGKYYTYFDLESLCESYRISSRTVSGDVTSSSNAFPPAASSSSEISSESSSSSSSRLPGAWDTVSERRLTTNSTSSIRPDIAADSWCRSHIVFHDAVDGKDDVYYVQTGYKEFMRECLGEDGRTLDLGAGAWAPTNGEGFEYSDPTGEISATYPTTGAVTRAVNYGSPRDAQRGLGYHVVYRQGDEWVGLSRQQDRAAWEEAMAALSDPRRPEIVLSVDNGIAQAGDFGETHSFKDLAFMAATPPDLGVELSLLRLPLYPRNLPTGLTAAPSDRVSELVAAPKRPAPPSFVDPLDISSIFPQGLIHEDERLPARYQLQDDSSGTVYTNLVSETGANASVVVFEPAANGTELKFVLGTRKCGNAHCAVRASDASEASTDPFSVTLQVMKGPDYRLEPQAPVAARISGTEVFQKTYLLHPGDEISTFRFAPGELVLERGTMYLFMVTTGSAISLYAQGTGGGNSVWYTNGNGEFTAYSPPATLPPYDGMAANVYYEGVLAYVPRSDTEADDLQGQYQPVDEEVYVEASMESCSGPLQTSAPLRLTTSAGTNRYPSIALTPSQNAWIVWHSDRSGDEDIYAARFLGKCSLWASSAFGIGDIRVTQFAETEFGRAKFARVATDKGGNAHVVYQVEEDKTGRTQIWYSRGAWSGQFSSPLKLTSSSGAAMAPDVAVGQADDGSSVVTVVWHDSRFGNWEVMAAQMRNGRWESSGLGEKDFRITDSGQANSMFPRISVDSRGDARVVFHSDRTGTHEVYSSSYRASIDAWACSAVGSTDEKISQAEGGAMFPAVSVGWDGEWAISWQDSRHGIDSDQIHEEIYVARITVEDNDSAESKCQPPAAVTSGEMDVGLKILGQDMRVAETTQSKDVYLQIRAPGALYWRASNPGEPFNNWQRFDPNHDQETMVVSWSLGDEDGLKRICVQVQDSQKVSFSVCQDVVLVRPVQEFDIEFFANADLSQKLPAYGPYPAIKAGDVYVKAVAPRILDNAPVFDVIRRGGASIFNQEMRLVETTAGDKQVFAGRFHVSRHDGVYNIDGMGRVIVKLRNEKTSNQPSSSSSSVSIASNAFDGEWPSYAGITPTAWTQQTVTIPLTSPDISLSISPTTSYVPYKFGFGAVGQPFVMPQYFGGGSLDFYLPLAARDLPAWLSDFENRVLTAKLVSSFPASPATLAEVEVQARQLAKVRLDLVSGLLQEPSDAGEIQAARIRFDNVPVVAKDIALALVLSDESYAEVVGEYGANARLFVLTIGSDVPSGEQAYYLREY